MRKAITAGVGVLVLAGLVWGGSEPWKTKPFAQWDANDLRKVMNDSPWAKQVDVPATWKPSDNNGAPGTGGGLSPTGSSPGVGNMGGRNSGGTAGAPLGGAGTGGVGPSPTGTPTASFEVRWSSSRTLRAAAVRSMVLGNGMSEADADKQLEQPQKYYEVTVLGRDMQPFAGLDEGTLKASTFLVAKKSKQKVSPESVHIDVGSDGKTVQGVIFSFPRTSDTGQATLGADEKGVEFSTTVTRANIKTSFDIAKMEDKDGRDL
ncbi:MAG: hypothetical protein WB869_09715 [Candidatus Acidiferrales bacterium]